MIAQPNVGWANPESTGLPDTNFVSNTTLFDFAGRAQPVLEATRLQALPPMRLGE